MQEHAHGQRLAYVASKVSASQKCLPHIAVLAIARSKAETKRIAENFARQAYRNATLYLIPTRVCPHRTGG
jgi:hypothetical protein